MDVVKYIFPILFIGTLFAQNTETPLILQNQPLLLFEKQLMQIVKKAKSSVVSIISTEDTDIEKSENLAKHSGVVIDQEGHIVTISSFLKKAKVICVKLESGKQCQAKLIGIDPSTNLAVIKVNSSETNYIEKGDSDQLDLGAILISIGNPYGLPGSVSLGIVSGLERSVEVNNTRLTGLIQTTANVNPGDAGGLAVDSSGKFVGIVSSTLEPGWIKNMLSPQGINFVLPSNTVYWVANEIIQHGEVRRGWVGIQVKNRLLHSGIIVTQVFSGSPAEKSGIQVGDSILAMNGTAIKSVDDLFFRISHTITGDEIHFQVEKNNSSKKETLSITLQEKPKK